MQHNQHPDIQELWATLCWKETSDSQVACTQNSDHQPSAGCPAAMACQFLPGEMANVTALKVPMAGSFRGS